MNDVIDHDGKINNLTCDGCGVEYNDNDETGLSTYIFETNAIIRCEVTLCKNCEEDFIELILK